MIKISENALKQIKYIKSSEERSSDEFLRIFVKRGGCSGFSYKLDFDSSLNSKKDKMYDQVDNIKVVIDNQSLLYVMGMTLDFEGGLNGQGFVFSNPNAKDTCSCGSSFAV